ncbi:aromatic ring-hydroxylating dioxygenase subunit alpha [Streptosporangium algeriense]|uniref:Aromatic ring-hydroxylating dioxygenase subunit alpha n=1 Tax=Streptosporangium algeriense TaxID=1682748 RepID=A0ABW3DKW0_9ACTN
MIDIEGIPADLDRGLLPSHVFNDPDIHRLELERLFTRAWCFVGHESEIPTNGDYVVRTIGEDPFILVRDEHGVVRVLLDACRHRGTRVCRVEKGNASNFRCPYHGWTYSNSGDLVGAPAINTAYRGLDRSQWGLVPAAHVRSVHGLVFASLDQNAPPLEDYLGGMKWYLDLMFGLHPEGLEVVGEPNRFVLDANWKIGADNFSGDDYHTVFLHKSMWEIGTIAIPPVANMQGYHVHAGPGHSVTFSIANNPDEPGPKFWGYEQEVVDSFDPDLVTPKQFEIARRARITVGTVFPNLSFIIAPLTDDPTKPPTGLISLRQWQPRGPGRMEIWNWVLVWKGTPEPIRERAYASSIGTFGPAGLFEQDDTEPWQSITQMSGTQYGRSIGMKLNYQMGHQPSGVGFVEEITGFPGPGKVYSPRYEEGVQLNFYRRWAAYLNGAA